MSKSFFKTLLKLIFIGFVGISILSVGKTNAYHFDRENSDGNLFQATLLDFSLNKRYIDGFIGMEALSKIEFASVITKTRGSLDIQYEVYAEKISGNDDFCNAIIALAELNGIEKYRGSLSSLYVTTTTQLGTWEFELKLPVSATNIPHGAECNVDLVFKGWRQDVLNFGESGFTDEERIELRLKARMIVLNEFLPNPNGLVPDYGFDFGDDNDDMPQGEWVELYNNSDFPFDLAGWYIWDDSNYEPNKIFITNSNTNLGTTIIPAHGWLVVYMNKAVLNNNSDTVKLFDQNNVLIDSHTYSGNDYCEVEPTPGEGNTDETYGTCSGVPPNKSYGRIPDGIGFWVDPIPTPGGPNKLEEEFEETENSTTTEFQIDEIASTTEETIASTTDEITETPIEEMEIEENQPAIIEENDKEQIPSTENENETIEETNRSNEDSGGLEINFEIYE